tara:strand:- start:45 stop:281 length:237 start_codon:yes stop_codon:yes gene_type:complete
MAVLIATRHAEVTKSDVTVFDAPQAIYVGTGGDIALRLIGDSTVVTYSNVPSGSWLPVLADKVMSTNTTASNIVRMEN